LTDAQARVSLQFVLAEALVHGAVGKHAFSASSLCNPRTLRIADRVICEIDHTWPGPERFKGTVGIKTADGRHFTATEEHNRGSPANPMSVAEIVDKFTENAAGVLSAERIERLRDAALGLEQCADGRRIIDLSIAGQNP
jgi:2-methylcitrate dehydratase PrpD